MPVITQDQEAAPERRRHRGRGMGLLLALPLLLLITLLGVVAIRPLQIGSLVFASVASSAPGIGWHARFNVATGKEGAFPLQDGWYEIRDGGAALHLSLQNWTYVVGYFRGGRVRPLK